MKLAFCEKCREWHWENENCPPVFLVKIPEWDGEEINDNWNTVHAHSVEHAAEKYVENVDDEYSCLNESITVWVINPIEQKIYIVKVQGERKITYYTDADTGTDIADFESAK